MLFILYAESAGHLPYGRSPGYTANALRTLCGEARAGRDRLDPASISLWDRLGTLTRALAERWMDWQLSVLGPAFTPLFHGLVRDPPSKRDHARIAAARNNVEARLEILDRYLGETAYVAGGGFTMGDIPLGIYAYRWYAFDIERKRLANVERWYNVLTGRRAFETHVMVGLG